MELNLLQLHAEFKLSDDFNGTFSDALREMATYCESEQAGDRHCNGGKGDNTMTMKKWQRTNLDDLKRLNEENGTRAAYSFYLGKWTI